MAAVAGDGNAVTNLDGLMEVVLVRGKAIAGQLKLTGTGHPLVTGCDSAPAVRKYLLKILRDIFGDSVNKYFGSTKWRLHETEPDGTCGFEARGIIAGVADPRDAFALSTVFSQRMKELLQLFNQDTSNWLDAVQLMEDVLQEEPNFNGRVVLVRGIATMNADHKKCSVSLRANQFTFDQGTGIVVPEDNGAWPLAARPIEPPQPCHGARALNSVAPSAHRPRPQRLARLPQRIQWPVYHLHVRDHRLQRLLGPTEQQQCAPHSGLPEHGVLASTLSSLIPRAAGHIFLMSRKLRECVRGCNRGERLVVVHFIS